MTRERERQLYIVPVSARAARARADRAVFRGIEFSVLASHGQDGGCEPLAQLSQGHNGGPIHVWAVRASHALRGTWLRIAPGDWFLFFSRGTIFGAACALGTCDSRPVATALWGASDGSEFRLLVFFDRAEQLDVPAWNYRSVLGSRFIGFRRLSDELRNTLIRKFGSVDAFVENELLRVHGIRRGETAEGVD